jgi:hypothetical protein
MNTKEFERALAEQEAEWWAKDAEWLRTPGTIENAQRRAGMIREFQNRVVKLAAVAQK